MGAAEHRLRRTAVKRAKDHYRASTVHDLTPCQGSFSLARLSACRHFKRASVGQRGPAPAVRAGQRDRAN
eukprot:4504365-Pyramimonas_sp.AAC.1